jgi:hypothetical protein
MPHIDPQEFLQERIQLLAGGNLNHEIRPSRGIGATTREQLLQMPNGEVALPRHEQMMRDISLPTIKKV